MNSEYWMPARGEGPFEREPLGFELLTAEEQGVLRRLQGRGPRRNYRPLSARKQRAALRQRRVVLDRLGSRDLRSLVQIVMELGL